MKSTVEKLEPTKVKITVEVPYEELKPSIDKAYKDLSQQVNVPGFRRGKIPAAIMDKRFGRGYIIQEAMNSAMQGFYSQSLQENEISPLLPPEVDVEKVPNTEGPREGELVFTAEIWVAPEFDIPALEGTELTVKALEVSEEDVANEIDQLRKRFATLTGVERAVENGDFVSIDMTARVDGKEVDSVSGYSYEVGAGGMIEGIDEALIGAKVDEERTFTTVLAGEHAGEEAEVTVTVRSVKVRELPEVDDDFAQLVSEHDTVAELKEDLTGQVKEQKVSEQALAARDELLAHLRETIEFPLPQGVIDAELAQRNVGEDEEAIQKATSEIERMLRDQMILDRLAKHHQVQVSQKELLDYLFHTAQMFGVEPAQLLGEDSSAAMASMVGEIARNKSIAKSLADVVVKDSEGNEVDLSKFIKIADEETEEEGEATQEEKA